MSKLATPRLVHPHRHHPLPNPIRYHSPRHHATDRFQFSLETKDATRRGTRQAAYTRCVSIQTSMRRYPTCAAEGAKAVGANSRYLDTGVSAPMPVPTPGLPNVNALPPNSPRPKHGRALRNSLGHFSLRCECSARPRPRRVDSRVSKPRPPRHVLPAQLTWGGGAPERERKRQEPRQKTHHTAASRSGSSAAKITAPARTSGVDIILPIAGAREATAGIPDACHSPRMQR
ncbi:hypothetical protein B0H10DRAFT_2308691 [Mycena sp. CBHHK59/15]|nr:hypothetical protein B0H10DRAFT_2308691 [Mycena sp. CBHHK59/15]